MLQDGGRTRPPRPTTLRRARRSTRPVDLHAAIAHALPQLMGWSHDASGVASSDACVDSPGPTKGAPEQGGTESSSSSPDTAPSRSKIHRQKAASWIPRPSPGSVVRGPGQAAAPGPAREGGFPRRWSRPPADSPPAGAPVQPTEPRFERGSTQVHRGEQGRVHPGEPPFTPLNRSRGALQTQRFRAPLRPGSCRSTRFAGTVSGAKHLDAIQSRCAVLWRPTRAPCPAS
jgi:hypothetical protein